jgi:hypothetical protein
LYFLVLQNRLHYMEKESLNPEMIGIWVKEDNTDNDVSELHVALSKSLDHAKRIIACNIFNSVVLARYMLVSFALLPDLQKF